MADQEETVLNPANTRGTDQKIPTDKSRDFLFDGGWSPAPNLCHSAPENRYLFLRKGV